MSNPVGGIDAGGGVDGTTAAHVLPAGLALARAARALAVPAADAAVGVARAREVVALAELARHLQRVIYNRSCILQAVSDLLGGIGPFVADAAAAHALAAALADLRLVEPAHSSMINIMHACMILHEIFLPYLLQARSSSAVEVAEISLRLHSHSLPIHPGSHTHTPQTFEPW